MDLGILADIDSGAYKFTKVLHLLSVIAGLGVTFWYGVYGARAKKMGESGDAMGSAGVADANFFVGSTAEKVIATIPVFGVALVFMSDDAWGFDQTWVWLSLTLFAIAFALANLVLLPLSRRMSELSRELASMGPPPAGASGPPPQVAQMDAVGKRLGAISGVLHLLLITILTLMIWKPGV